MLKMTVTPAYSVLFLVPTRVTPACSVLFLVPTRMMPVCSALFSVPTRVSPACDILFLVSTLVTQACSVLFLISTHALSTKQARRCHHHYYYYYYDYYRSRSYYGSTSSLSRCARTYMVYCFVWWLSCIAWPFTGEPGPYLAIWRLLLLRRGSKVVPQAAVVAWIPKRTVLND